MKVPKGNATRPTSGRLRGAFFDICRNDVEGAFFLDLFSGAGAVGLESISRGAQNAVFVENNRTALSCIRSNVELLQVSEHVEIFRLDVFKALLSFSKKGRKFTIIYADPPYQKSFKWKGKSFLYSELVIKLVDEGNILDPSGSLFIEESKEKSFDCSCFDFLFLYKKWSYGGSVLYQYKRKK